jgi:hypothetical protein
VFLDKPGPYDRLPVTSEPDIPADGYQGGPVPLTFSMVLQQDSMSSLNSFLQFLPISLAVIFFLYFQYIIKILRGLRHGASVFELRRPPREASIKSCSSGVNKECSALNCQLCQRGKCPGRKAPYDEKRAREYGIRD